MQFSNLDPRGKSRLASECGASYACIGRTPENFTALCPIDWLVDVDNTCIAPGNYGGPCLGRKSFVGLTVQERALWGQYCEVKWPARDALEDLLGGGSDDGSSLPCQKDYTNPCPVGWLNSGHDCVAPMRYDGACGPIVRNSLTYRQKQ